ncbi:MAG TPA: hypothetical protein VLX28_26120 [Thermoanaerobaculia bacterium]|nr:hypothetical protein [Thermoanaerobaculia bacterium]
MQVVVSIGVGGVGLYVLAQAIGSVCAAAAGLGEAGGRPGGPTPAAWTAVSATRRASSTHTLAAA